MSRVKLKKGEEKFLLDYYGHGHKVCVVTGTKDGEDGISIDWSHLDENSSNTNVFNVVPLSRGYNQEQERWRKKSHLSPSRINLTSDLSAQLLLEKTRNHFQRAYPALAYGCARVGQTLALNYPQEFRAREFDVFAFLSQCFFYLPYRMNTVLLEGLLDELVRILQKEKVIPAEFHQSLIQAIANLYQDLGNIKKAEELHTVIKQQNNISGKVSSVMERRRAVSGLLDNSIDINILSAIDYAIDNHGDFDFSASGSIAKAWFYLSHDEPRRALKSLETYHDALSRNNSNPKTLLSPHNIFEFYLTRAAALVAIGQEPAKFLEENQRFINNNKETKLRPIFTEYIAPQIFIPHPEISKQILLLRQPIVWSPNLGRALDTASKELIETPVTYSSIELTWLD